ncbi:MAG: UvrD-helicase domain-containing protein, partial [Prevotella sp.]|nr:UvrD-helicase domain-containing protein [Prevotella sp.]
MIAPAGHGKTTAIADCLLLCPNNSCQLILTHTHAGIASLRKKLSERNVPSNKYNLETITGFAQQYVLGFLGPSALPNEDDESYFDKAIEKCSQIITTDVIQFIIRATYNGVFVDEYQDCTIDQHDMITKLSGNLPLHLFGDPLQGIFTFENKPLIDFERNLMCFKQFKILDYPWRWDKENPLLGEEILSIRKALEMGNEIELYNKSEAGLFLYSNLNNNNENYYHCLRRIIDAYDSNSLLIICPSYKEHKRGYSILKGDLNDRIKLKQRIDTDDRFYIVDAIDDQVYYNVVKRIDVFISNCRDRKRIKKIAHLYDILIHLYLNKT